MFSIDQSRPDTRCRGDAPYNPWNDLKTRFQAWKIRYTEMDEGYVGFTDFVHREVQLNAASCGRQHRSTLAHEIIHIERGHRRPQSRATESKIEEQAVRRLIPDWEAAVALLHSMIGRPSDELAKLLNIDCAHAVVFNKMVRQIDGREMMPPFAYSPDTPILIGEVAA